MLLISNVSRECISVTIDETSFIPLYLYLGEEEYGLVYWSGRDESEISSVIDIGMRESNGMIVSISLVGFSPTIFSISKTPLDTHVLEEGVPCVDLSKIPEYPKENTSYYDSQSSFQVILGEDYLRIVFEGENAELKYVGSKDRLFFGLNKKKELSEVIIKDVNEQTRHKILSWNPINSGE